MALKVWASNTDSYLATNLNENNLYLTAGKKISADTINSILKQDSLFNTSLLKYLNKVEAEKFNINNLTLDKI